MLFRSRVTPPGGEPRGYTVGRSDPTGSLGSPLPAGSMDIAITTPPIPMVYYAPNPGTATSWPNRSGGTAPVDELYFALKPLSKNHGEVDYQALIAGKPFTTITPMTKMIGTTTAIVTRTRRAIPRR